MIILVDSLCTSAEDFIREQGTTGTKHQVTQMETYSQQPGRIDQTDQTHIKRFTCIFDISSSRWVFIEKYPLGWAVLHRTHRLAGVGYESM